RLHDKLLLILSAHSVLSSWVREEVESSLERERREKRLMLFPVRLDDAVMDATEAWAASVRRQRHIGDFRQWKSHDVYQNGLQRLLRDLKANS
ncbi:MAG: TIR domain-containing protein, partial [Bryobacteraceae bacterium]